MQLGREVMPGERLRAARQAIGIGQRKLAKRCYYTQSTVANVENGQIKMSMALARAAAKELHVSAAWLLGLDEPEISYETALMWMPFARYRRGHMCRVKDTRDALCQGVRLLLMEEIKHGR